MAINKLVSISNVITQFGEETSIDMLTMKPVLVRWAKQGDLRIGSRYTFKKKYFVLNVIKAEGRMPTAELPLSAVHVEDMLLGDHLANCPDIFNNTPQAVDYGVSAGYPYAWAWRNDVYTARSLNWTVMDNHIEFERDFTDDYVTVELLCYEEDAQGLPMVNENHIEAISIFLQLKWMGKQRFHMFRNKKWTNSDNNTMEIMKKEFVHQSRLSRANDNSYSDKEEYEVADMLDEELTGNSRLNLY